MDNKVSLVNYFMQPFVPVLRDKNLIEKMPISVDVEPLFSQNGIERIIDEFDLNIDIDNGNLSGLVGELLSNQILASYLNSRVLNYSNIETREIKGKKGYVINSQDDYIAKLNGVSNRIFILKKGENSGEGGKSGFVNIGEIDGLHMIKQKRDIGKSKRSFYIVESKTGLSNINPDHILNDVILPLKYMYKDPINYILMAFGDSLFSEENLKIYNGSVTYLYHFLKKENISFMPIAFPFSRNRFNELLNKLENNENKKVKVRHARYNLSSGEMSFIMPDGTCVEGYFNLKD